MARDDDPKSAPPSEEAKIATVEASAEAVVPTNVLEVDKTSPPALAEPETLVAGLKYLQQRIPGFVQLSIDEERSMTRAAYLDPAVVEAGIHLAGAWDRAGAIIGRGQEELRQAAEESRRWDDVVRELKALTNGIADANLERKHRLGRDILILYNVLGGQLQLHSAECAHLRPYYEEMKRLNRRRPKKSKAGTTAKDEPDTTKE